jgi:hypothetical protein
MIGSEPKTVGLHYRGSNSLWRNATPPDRMAFISETRDEEITREYDVVAEFLGIAFSDKSAIRIEEFR